MSNSRTHSTRSRTRGCQEPLGGEHPSTNTHSHRVHRNDSIGVRISVQTLRPIRPTDIGVGCFPIASHRGTVRTWSFRRDSDSLLFYFSYLKLTVLRWFVKGRGGEIAVGGTTSRVTRRPLVRSRPSHRPNQRRNIHKTRSNLSTNPLFSFEGVSKLIPLKLTVLGWFVKGGRILNCKQRGPPFKKGGSLGVVHIAGNIFLL